MERRELLSGFAKAAAFLAVPSALSTLASAQSPLPQIEKAKPYGADRLENTDHKQLAESIKDQLLNAGLPLPADTYQPFPDKTWKAFSLPLPLRNTDVTGTWRMFPPFILDMLEPFRGKIKDEYANSKEIVGTSFQNRDLEEDTQCFNQYFKNQPPCSLQVHQEAWAVDTALHETVHYIASNIIFDGVSLHDVAYSIVNKVSPGQNRDSYIASLQEFLKKHPKSQVQVDKLVLAQATYRQIRERIADAGAALYALSNYTDTTAIVDYFEKLANYRMADFTNSDHRTSSSIRAALKTFSEIPRQGLTIVEAALWAANIVVAQPEFQRNLGEMANDARNWDRAKDKFLKNKGEFVWDKEDDSEILRAIMDSRNAVCRAATPSP